MNDCRTLLLKVFSFMVEPDPEPTGLEIAAPGTTNGQTGTWNRNTVLVAVDRIDHSRTPDCVQLANPAVSGDRAAAFIDREIRRFYRDQAGNLPDLRFYVVWASPERHRPEDFAGLHFGVGERARQGIIATNSGRVEGLLWARVCSLESGRAIFLRDLEENVLCIPGFKPWRTPVDDRIHLWR